MKKISNKFNILLPPCVLMAGGLGSRLGAITKHKPKPAIIIKGRPFILHKLDSLINRGFKHFLFITSYKEEILKNIVKPYLKEKNISFEFFSDNERLGTFNAIYSIRKNLANNFFYTNSDEISNFDVVSMYNKFLNDDVDVCSLLKKELKGNLEVNDNFVLGKKYNYTGSHIDLGCKFIDKRIFNYVKKPYKKIEDFIYDCKLKEMKVSFLLSTFLPLRIDTPNDIRNFNRVYTSL